MTTTGDKYEPTPAEEKLLEALLDPANRYKSKTAVCEIAGINRVTYYKVFAKEAFVAHYRERSKDLIGEALGPIINALTKEAKRGSFQHQKLALEMAGLHTDSIEVADKTFREITSDMTPTEAAQIYLESVKNK